MLTRALVFTFLMILVFAPQALAVPPVQETVTVLSDRHVRAIAGGKVVYYLKARRPTTGSRTVLPLLDRKYDSQKRYWLLVRLPGRANGEVKPPLTGWIRAYQTRTNQTNYHLVVNRSTRRVNLYENGRSIRTFRVIIGHPSTPTPRGTFFVEENIKMPQGSAGGPFALALSARSNVLQEFAGGPGQVALHGRNGVGGTLGTAVSHGCIRLDNSAITWLSTRIDSGTPVTIK